MESQFYFYAQMNISSPTLSGDNLLEIFPKGRQVTVISKKFNDTKECIDACNKFIFSRVDHLNNIGKDLIVVWDANPEYSSMFGDDKEIGKSARKWEENQIMKYYVVKREDTKTGKNIESPFITTIMTKDKFENLTSSSRSIS